MNKQGFDDRIPEELKPTTRNIEISFVGGLGTQNFLQRTEFINSLALKGHDFKWWGYWWEYGSDGRDLSSFPKLMKIFQGPTSGLEIYQIYKDSKINFNDYVDTANNVGFNQRIFEVMGCGGFLLTREAKNFVDTFPADIFITYETLADCQDKIKYFLKNESERKEIAQAGQKFVLENYNYRNIVANFKLDLEKHLF
jgi:spore maturation protein CgeB